MKSPNRLNFTPEEIDALMQRLDGKCLKEGDYSLLTDILRAMIWLNFSLQEKELTIKRLRKIFGIKTESAKKLLQLAQGKSSNQNGIEEQEDSTEEDSGDGAEGHSEETDLNEGNKGKIKGPGKNPTKSKPKNHGHRPSADYTQARVVHIAHQTLKKGDRCPDCQKGKLFHLKPGAVINITGQPWLQVEIYRPERLRCGVCGKVFTASLPQELQTGSRADSSAKAIVTLLKYRGGVPFYRQGQIQEILGAPISASEIWEMTEGVANAVQPIYALLCKEAADAELVHNDDTKARIMSRMQELKELGDEAERTGTVTTCIIAALKKIGVTIGLFFTGAKHAGENLDELLQKRSDDLSFPIQQCDALSHNKPKNQETQLSNCLAHLRRKFYEIVDMWPKEVSRIIGEFALVFANDDSAPKDDKERLKWHQEKSDPIMQRIKGYCNNLISNKQVEPNSSLGKAIAYLNNHWDGFTLFLKVPGVPLTNNIAERLIKRAVLNRKNAYFFHNETGAKIADILMSIMETCVLNKVNPYNFLIAIQQNQDDVRKNPHLWLPWLYEKRLKDLESIPT